MELPILCDICHPHPLRFAKLLHNARNNNEMHPNYQHLINWSLHTPATPFVHNGRSLYNALLKFRLRRLARLSRWMVGDQLISEVSSTKHEILPVTSEFFFSTLNCIDGYDILIRDLNDILRSDRLERHVIVEFERCIDGLYHGNPSNCNGMKTKIDQSQIGWPVNSQLTTYLVGRWGCFYCGMYNFIDSNECLCCANLHYAEEAELSNRTPIEELLFYSSVGDYLMRLISIIAVIIYYRHYCYYWYRIIIITSVIILFIIIVNIIIITIIINTIIEISNIIIIDVNDMIIIFVFNTAATINFYCYQDYHYHINGNKSCH